MAIKRDYFGLSYITSIILAIIPITSFILGALTRIKEGCIVAGILRILLGWNIIYIVDIICMIIDHKILRILDI